MNGLSVIIPSRDAHNLSHCMAALAEHEPTVQGVIVDDGIDWNAYNAPRPDYSEETFLVVKGVKPFVFARNVNLGIQAVSHENDVVILNDDAQLETPGGFRAMQQIAQQRPDIGIIAATCNNVGNRNQWRKPGETLRPEDRMVCFVCVFIPRSTLNRVGLLDERYVDYGCDDDDYSFEVRKAGLKLGIYDGCYVDHARLKSSYRGEAGAGGNFLPNLKRFIAKWGTDNWGKTREQSQFAGLFPAA